MLLLANVINGATPEWRHAFLDLGITETVDFGTTTQGMMPSSPGDNVSIINIATGGAPGDQFPTDSQQNKAVMEVMNSIRFYEL